MADIDLHIHDRYQEFPQNLRMAIAGISFAHLVASRSKGDLMRHVKSAVPFLLAFAILIGASASAAAQEAFIGEIRYVAFNFAPRGWAECNGQIMSISQNTALFSLLGTTYGGNGQTTFALPNMQGRVPIHAGQGPGLSMYVQGETDGAEHVTLSVSQMPPHTHPLGASGAEAGAISPNGNVLAAKQRVPLYNPGPPDVGMSPLAIGNAGSGQPFSVLQPSLTIKCIIALEGIFPSRP
ncbi:MAG: Tail Collar domain protein [Acidobacteria bacterium]|nr:Tail Collar domain protein [Acidobacteriota bacterium]